MTSGERINRAASLGARLYEARRIKDPAVRAERVADVTLSLSALGAMVDEDGWVWAEPRPEWPEGRGPARVPAGGGDDETDQVVGGE